MTTQEQLRMALRLNHFLEIQNKKFIDTLRKRDQTIRILRHENVIFQTEMARMKDDIEGGECGVKC